MKIGYITADLHHGHGWAHYSLALLEAVHAQGVELVAVTATNSPTDYPFPVYPLLPTIVPAEQGQLLKLIHALPQTRRLLASCDLIHCTVEPYAPLAWMIADKRPYFITGHGTYVRAGWNRNLAVRQLHRHSFRAATAVVTVSHYTERVLHQHMPDVSTRVIPQAIDPTRFANLPALPQPPNRPTVLTAGGVKKRKGTPQLVRAIASVRAQVPNVQCVIIGDTEREPDTTAEVRALIAEYGLEDHVFLLGFVDEETLLGWYGAADVFVLPSINDGYKFEGFGLVHLEASSAGLPVIGADNCGAEEAVLHNKTGLLIRQASIDEELPTAILDLLTNPERAKAMAAAGRAHAQTQTWAAKATKMIALYNEVL